MSGESVSWVVPFALTIAVVLVGFGVAWGVVVTKLSALGDRLVKIEKLLNGDEPIFLRKKEAELMHQKSDREHQGFERRIAALEEWRLGPPA